MRKELNDIEQIDRYLSGQMAADEITAFESRLAGEPGLRENLRLHEDVLKGIDRTMHVESIRRARQRYYRNNFLKWGGAGLGIVLIAGLVISLSMPGHRPPARSTSAGVHQTPAVQPVGDSLSARPIPGRPSYHDDRLPAANETGTARWSAADSNLKAQTFWLAAGRDTVVETAAGIVLSIPASTFLDANHRPIAGTFELVLKEALDVPGILKAGLSTLAGGRLLETGGMFFIDARQNGKPLSIDPLHALFAEIPTDSVRPGMQLFTGKRLAGGMIDWTDPRPLEHDLLAVDVRSLNFYPPHYLDSVAGWGYDRNIKRFTDSLYYAFAGLFPGQAGPIAVENTENTESTATAGAVKATLRGNTVDTDAVPARPFLSDTLHRDHTRGRTRPVGDSAAAACGINPAKIAAIWNDRFQNTLIATREFEQRLILIHQTGDNNLLDLYVNHLDLDLSEIDSIAASETTGHTAALFQSFAAHHDGKVRHGDTRFAKLREYYRTKARIFADAAAKTSAEFWEKESRLDDQAANRTAAHGDDSIERLTRNFSQELQINLQAACGQLGYDYNIYRRPWTGKAISASAVYPVTVTNTGWCNIDRYAIEQTYARQTIDYTDQSTGRRTVITYSPVYFKFTSILQYDRIYLYLLPDKLNSFIRVSDSAGVFTEKLNSLLTYRLVVIAYQKEQAFYYSQTNIQPTTYSPIPLVPMSAADIDLRLQQLGNTRQLTDLQDDQEYFRFEYHDRLRQKRDQLLRDLTDKMMNAFFNCLIPPEGSLQDSR